jgi:hypothetical protein
MRTRASRTSFGTAAALLGWLLLTVASSATAGLTSAQKCAIAEQKAAVKKLGAKLKCHQQALLAGTAVDSACLDKAETKFNDAIAKAEAPGGCAVSGGGPDLESAVDACVVSILSRTPATTTTTTSTTTTSTLPFYSCANPNGGLCGGSCPPGFSCTNLGGQSCACEANTLCGTNVCNGTCPSPAACYPSFAGCLCLY